MRDALRTLREAEAAAMASEKSLAAMLKDIGYAAD